MKKEKWFESWFNSPYYRILYQHRDAHEAENFCNTLIQKLQLSANSRIWDIGCGEGRFAVSFANKGFEVVGIDLSENNILKAKQLEHDKLRFYVHDMRHSFRINYFDLACNLFTSFGYFDKEIQNLAAAKAIAWGLKPGGLFIMDYLNSTKILEQLKPHQVLEKEGIRFEIDKHYDGRFIHKTISFEAPKGTAHQYTEKVATFSKEALEALFLKVNLVPQSCFGDYQLNPYDAHSSDRLILVFKKIV